MTQMWTYHYPESGVCSGTKKYSFTYCTLRFSSSHHGPLNLWSVGISNLTTGMQNLPFVRVLVFWSK